MKNRSPSFPKKVAEKNRERWVVYYFDTDKQKRWARRFSTEAEALEFFREKMFTMRNWALRQTEFRRQTGASLSRQDAFSSPSHKFDKCGINLR